MLAFLVAALRIASDDAPAAGYDALRSRIDAVQAACEADAACLSIYDGGCDGEGDWSTCRDATGYSMSGQCLYVKP